MPFKKITFDLVEKEYKPLLTEKQIEWIYLCLVGVVTEKNNSTLRDLAYRGKRKDV